MSLLPWQSDAADLFIRLANSGRMPHALLLTGDDIEELRHFASWAVSHLMCVENGESAPCGQCQACHLLANGSHGDYFHLQADEGSDVIKVEAVRELGQWAINKPALASMKCALLDPADALNRNAANALLKTLEEPPGNTSLLLLSTRPDSLPATIRSRCQVFRFPAPDHELVQKWLQEQGMDIATHKALSTLLGSSPLKLLEIFRQGEYQPLLDLEGDLASLAAGEAVVTEVVKRAAGVNPQLWIDAFSRILLSNMKKTALAPCGQDNYQRAIAHLDGRDLEKMLERLYKAKKILAGPVREDLMKHKLLTAWSRTFGRVA